MGISKQQKLRMNESREILKDHDDLWYFSFITHKPVDIFAKFIYASSIVQPIYLKYEIALFLSSGGNVSGIYNYRDMQLINHIEGGISWPRPKLNLIACLPGRMPPGFPHAQNTFTLYGTTISYMYMVHIYIHVCRLFFCALFVVFSIVAQKYSEYGILSSLF